MGLQEESAKQNEAEVIEGGAEKKRGCEKGEGYDRRGE
jgi:hypothetical protein